MHGHLVSHIQNPTLTNNNTLHVIGVLFNPMRYHSRLRLFREWYKRMQATPNVKVYVVECVLWDRQFEVTDKNNPTHLQVHTNQEIWHKESLINLGVKHLLPRDWQYMSWCDTDITFNNNEWAQEAMHKMQHYDLIQPWRDCIDLGFYGQILTHFQSFSYVHRLKVKKQTGPNQPYKYAHSGFSWACTKYFWENIEKLMDFAILGSADHHMAWASIGGVEHSVHHKMSDGFKMACNEWQRRAFRVTRGDIGYVCGTIQHHFHGPKARRRYRERWQILIENHYDPYTDTIYDAQGLIKLVGKPHLLEEIREYFEQRNEDSIEEK